MSWFTRRACKVCEEKDRRIADLYRLAEDYRRLAIPPNSADLSATQRETDLLLNPDVNHTDLREAEYEAAALMSGNYDNWSVDVQ